MELAKIDVIQIHKFKSEYDFLSDFIRPPW